MNINYTIFLAIIYNIQKIYSAPITNDDPNKIKGITFRIEGDVNMIPDVNGELHPVTYHQLEDDIKGSDEFGGMFRQGTSDGEIQDYSFNVHFSLFTNQNKNDEQILIVNDTESVKKSNFNSNNPTRVIVHGWQNSRTSPVNIVIRDAYLKKDNFNVIVVDWSEGASSINYAKSRNSIKYVGYKVAKFIEFMKINAGLSIEQLHLVGHSLGAHICGMAGKYVENDYLNTIVGLDPAGPLFYLQHPDDRLSADDAEYVEVLHTNGGLLGMLEPIGDADYYINGGEKQPGCGFDMLRVCSHARAVDLFAESINSAEGFWSMPCNFEELKNSSCNRLGNRGIMGEHEWENKKFRFIGVYQLLTRGTAPYARGLTGLTDL